MIIDAHSHYLGEQGYLENLITEYQHLGIEKGCISGLGPLFSHQGNDEVEQAFQKYPDTILGFGYVRLGADDAKSVNELFSRGFKGLKFTCPPANYDNRDFYSVYEQAEKLGMPCLFHCGIVVTARGGRQWNVSSARMRPAFLDTIARAFPGLNIICAHMGVPWFEEATTIARLVDNVYVDITGSPEGWRLQKSTAFFEELFYWEGAYSKVIWGTDVHCSDMEAALDRDRRLFRELGLTKEQMKKVFGGTIAGLLSL